MRTLQETCLTIRKFSPDLAGCRREDTFCIVVRWPRPTRAIVSWLHGRWRELSADSPRQNCTDVAEV